MYFKELVESGLVSEKEQNGLFIYKYKKKVFWDNLWHLDLKLLDARGTVLDKEGNLIQYPVTKIFNRNENGTDISRDHKVIAVKKINGFMVAVSLYKGELLVSTTGSMESEYVTMAKEKLPLESLKKNLLPNHTYIFEIVHENDPHIIEETPGCYLLAVRQKYFNSPIITGNKISYIAAMLDDSIKYPESYHGIMFSDVLKMVKDCKHEGFVVYDLESDIILKIKSPYYLTSKFFARKKDLSKVWEGTYKEYFDEEYYGLCEFLQQNCKRKTFEQMEEQFRLKIIRDFFNKSSIIEKLY